MSTRAPFLRSGAPGALLLLYGDLVTDERSGDFDVDHELTRLMRRHRARALKRATDVDESLDLTSYLLLTAIYDHGDGVRGSDLAEMFAVHKSTISRSITALERLGLVERLADPADGRAQILRASAKAESRLGKIRSRGREWLAEVLAEWSPEERETFAKGLARFNDAAENFPGS